MVSWLPLYHDMGLVGFLALPMTTGVDLVQAAPQDFMAKPGNWMQWISDWGGTATAGPNFSWVLATRALAVKRATGPRPVDADAGAERCRAGRSEGGRGVRRRRRAVRLHAGRRVPGVRHGRDRDRRGVPTPWHGPGVRHRRPRGARTQSGRQADRGQRSRRAGARGTPAAVARHRRAGDGDEGRRSGHARGRCPSVTSANCCCGARR